MLDRKIKDIDASIELMEDRKKSSKIMFFIFFFVGWCIVLISVALVPYKYDELGLGAGIAILIFATWFLISWWGYDILIMIKRLDVKDK